MTYYRDLQHQAKLAGIPANQSKDALFAAILDTETVDGPAPAVDFGEGTPDVDLTDPQDDASGVSSQSKAPTYQDF